MNKVAANCGFLGEVVAQCDPAQAFVDEDFRFRMEQGEKDREDELQKAAVAAAIRSGVCLCVPVPCSLDPSVLQHSLFMHA